MRTASAICWRKTELAVPERLCDSCSFMALKALDLALTLNSLDPSLHSCT